MLNIFDGISNYCDDYSLYAGSSGVELIVDTGADITDATSCELHVTIPTPTIVNGIQTSPVTLATWIGTKFSNRYIKYTLKSTDIPVKGIYKIYSLVKWTDKEIPGEMTLLRIKAVGE